MELQDWRLSTRCPGAPPVASSSNHFRRRRRSSFFNLRPAALLPVLDPRFVAFQSATHRLLSAPPVAQHLSDVLAQPRNSAQFCVRPVAPPSILLRSSSTALCVPEGSATALPASASAGGLVRRGAKRRPASPARNGILPEKSATSTNWRLPWARQLASKSRKPSDSFGVLRDSASHRWING